MMMWGWVLEYLFSKDEVRREAALNTLERFLDALLRVGDLLWWAGCVHVLDQDGGGRGGPAHFEWLSDQGGVLCWQYLSLLHVRRAGHGVVVEHA